jgi:ABC-2 type transport system ATP-binding protein
MTSLRYLAEIPLIPDSCPAEPKLEDLYLWLFPQEGSVDSEKEEVK